MPLLEKSAYSRRPWYLRGGHMETIIPSIFYKAEKPAYSRERIELSDGDFLDLDWLHHSNSTRLIIISHGLEGSSDRHYVRRSASFFYQHGWHVLAWNCRSCSGEMNRLPKFYHHGATEDLSAVVDHALKNEIYQTVVLMGVSMGGSMSIKYTSEDRTLSDKIKAVVSFSVPCNLKDSALALCQKSNRFYEKRFVKKLVGKVKQKAIDHPGINIGGIDEIKDFDTFHQRFTLPIYGFRHMDDFYRAASCDQYFDGMRIPTLVCNAANDPLLIDGCYPVTFAEKTDLFTLEIPRQGGHVGFSLANDLYTYMEYRAADYLTSLGLD